MTSLSPKNTLLISQPPKPIFLSILISLLYWLFNLMIGHGLLWVKRMAQGGLIKPEKLCWGVVGQSSFVYSSVHSEIFLKHIRGGRKCAKHRDGL